MPSKNSPDLSLLLARFEIEGVRYEGLVLEANSHAVRIAFPAGVARVFAINRPVCFTIGASSRETPMIVEGTPTDWRSAEDGEHVLFAMNEDDFAGVQSILWSDRGIRVPVRGEKAVRVRLDTLSGEVSIETAMVDVSESGLGLILAARDDQKLAIAMRSSAAGSEAADAWRVEVSFRLPGSDEEIFYIAEIHYRMWAKSCVKYGVSFDLERTAELYSDQVDTVGDQMARYQELRKAG